MPYSGLADFITQLEKAGELHRISSFADPVLEIAEITDRIVKTGGKALLFENNGTRFPLLINAYGSGRRLSMALGTDDISATAGELEKLFNMLTGSAGSVSDRIRSLPELIRVAGYLPVHTRGRGRCRQVIHRKPDLTMFPVLKCWPHDGGRFITLPVVHTRHPVTGKTNAGMYRMQVFGPDTAGLHWHRHKTGANHYEEWKKTGKKMPVSVSLGGDPVYTYCATAPLPENINEYILAGFLRKKRVKLVKCLTNDLYVPADADIVIEGYVDPSEPPVMEGPFGDHTGFYSLADLYPLFHVTCITHAADAVYPATIVGIPPHEDTWLALATEKIFLAPLKLAIQPEIIDFHMPVAGVAHNLVIVKIKKSFPGQGMKVISSLSGAGQMMFTKYMVVVSGDVDIRNYRELAAHIAENTVPERDFVFSTGPMDVLDHSSDRFSFGGKAGVDATEKLPEETGGIRPAGVSSDPPDIDPAGILNVPFIKGYREYRINGRNKILLLGANPSEDSGSVDRICRLLKENSGLLSCCLVLVLDHTVDLDDLNIAAWQLLGNSDPVRDHCFISPGSVLIDGTIKVYRKGGFPRPWPNVVCASRETIESVDKKWDSLGFDRSVPSFSLSYSGLLRDGEDTVSI